MAAEKQKNPFLDPAARATNALDSVLAKGDLAEDIAVIDPSLVPKRDPKTGPDTESSAVEQSVPVSEGDPSGDPHLLSVSDRERLRVLMVLSDTDVFSAGSRMQTRMQSYGALFDELHIIVLSRRGQDFRPLRLAQNVWVYPTDSRAGYLYPSDALRIARKQLTFSDGFRVDIVTGGDPFWAGLAAYAISRRMKRALHLEVPLNPFAPAFRRADPANGWRVRVASFLLPRADGIRVFSERLKKSLIARLGKRVTDTIDVLPVFSDVVLQPDAVPSSDLRERYPHLKFIILIASALTKESGVAMALDVVHPILTRYPTVGAVIIGDGPLRKYLEDRAIALGIQNQVVFDSGTNSRFSYYKTANLFLSVSSHEEDAQELVDVAVLGLPALVAEGGIARDIFVDGKSGFVCAEGDAACFTSRIEEFLSSNELRVTFSEAARERALGLVTTNVDGYLDTYRTGLEQCVIRYHERTAADT